MSDSNSRRYLRVCHIRIQKINNLEISFKFLMSLGISLEISPEDLLNHSPTDVLGLVWSLICFFHLKTTNICPMMAKRDLLKWLRTKGIDCADLTRDWKDGRYLAKLVNTFAPGSVNIIEDEPPLALLEKSMHVAQLKLGVPKIIEARDMGSPYPDEMSNITFISYFRDRNLDTEDIELYSHSFSSFLSSSSSSIESSSSSSWSDASSVSSEDIYMSPLPKKRHKTSQHSSNARFKYFKFIVHKARVLETTSNDVKSSTTRRLEYDEGEATVSTEGGEGDSQNISYTDTTRKTTTNTSKASPKKTRTKQHRHHTHKNPRGKDKQRDRTSKRPYFPQKGEDTEEEQVDDRQHHYYVVATDWNSYRHQSHVVVVGKQETKVVWNFPFRVKTVGGRHEKLSSISTYGYIKLEFMDGQKTIGWCLIELCRMISMFVDDKREYSQWLELRFGEKTTGFARVTLLAFCS